MAFGERLAQLRRDLGLTQEEFAEQLNVSRQAVSKWESCRGYPEVEKIICICNRYGISMGELFAEEVPPAESGMGRGGAGPDGHSRPCDQETEHSGSVGALFTEQLPPAESGPVQESGTGPAPPPHRAAWKRYGNDVPPAAKWAGAGGLIGVTLLMGLCLRYLRGGGDGEMTIFWIGAVIVFGVVEAVTAGLVSIWFVPGAVAGLIAAMAGLGILAQLVLFLAVSAAALAATRPLVKKLSAGKAVPTNADRVLGRAAKVTETIDNENSTGTVYVDGKIWTARSLDGAVIPAGSRVRVQEMEGVKLLVREIAEAEMKKEEETAC